MMILALPNVRGMISMVRPSGAFFLMFMGILGTESEHTSHALAFRTKYIPPLLCSRNQSHEAQNKSICLEECLQAPSGFSAHRQGIS